MKNPILVSVCLLTSVWAYGCDICGCSSSNTFVGILPTHRQHFVGTRYQSQRFLSSHLRNDPHPARETFQSMDAWGRYYLTRRFQVMAMIPYQHFVKTENSNLLINNGLGDMTLLAHYALWDSNDSFQHNIRHLCSIGGGLKLPTGNYQKSDIDGTRWNPNFQMGSGTWDFLISSYYSVRWNNQGIFSEINARLNTENRAFQYRSGHRCSGMLQYFYWWTFSEMNILPRLGGYAEWIGEQKTDNRNIGDSDGYALYAHIGLDIFYKRLAVNCLYQSPLKQHLGDGLLKAQERCSVNLFYLF